MLDSKLNSKTCTFPECNNKRRARNLCVSHYNQVVSGMDLRPLNLKYRDSKSAEHSFWAKVVKGDGCWVWIGAKTRGGYGSFWANGSRTTAHRFSYELNNGRKIPSGLCVCHTCDNPPCVNPEHFFLGTIADNNKDCLTKRRHSRHSARLSEIQVKAIRDRASAGYGQSALSREYGVAQTTIWKIINGRTWKHVT